MASMTIDNDNGRPIKNYRRVCHPLFLLSRLSRSTNDLGSTDNPKKTRTTSCNP